MIAPGLDRSVSYLLRSAPVNGDPNGSVVGVLPVLTGRVRHESGRPSVLDLSVHGSSPVRESIRAGNVVQVSDKQGLHDGYFVIDNVRRILTGEGERLLAVQALDYMKLLGDSVVSELKIRPEENKTVSQILTSLLAFHNNRGGVQFATGTVDSSIGGQIRSVNIENDTILRALIRLQETVGGVFRVEVAPTNVLFHWTEFPVWDGKRIVLGHNLKGITLDTDSSGQGNLIYMFGRGEGTARVESPTVAAVPDNYWPLNLNTHDVTDFGDHFTAVGSPGYTLPARSPDLLKNGDLRNSTGWTGGAGWVLDGVDRAFEASGASSTLVKDLSQESLVAGDFFVFRAVIKSFSAGSLTVALNGGAASSAMNANGTWEVVIASGSGTQGLVVTPSSATLSLMAPELRAQDETAGGMATAGIILNGTPKHLHNTGFTAYRISGGVVQPFALELKFRILVGPTGGGYHVLWADRGASNKTFSIGVVETGGVLRMRVRVDNAGVTNYDGTINVRAGVWHHLGFNYDGSNVRLFVDFNRHVNTAVVLPALSPAPTVAGIGAITDGVTGLNHCNAVIDDVRFHDSGLVNDITTQFRDCVFFDSAFYMQGYFKDDDSIDEHGLFEKAFSDKSVTHPDTLFNVASRLLEEIKNPIPVYEIDTMDLSGVDVLIPGYNTTGSELVTNGTFTSDLSSWVSSGEWVWETGYAKKDVQISGHTLIQTISTVPGRFYRVAGERLSGGFGAVVVSVHNGAWDELNSELSAAQLREEFGPRAAVIGEELLLTTGGGILHKDFLALGDEVTVRIFALGPVIFGGQKVDNVSLKQMETITGMDEGLEHFVLNDTVRVIDPELDVDDFQIIRAVDINLDNPRDVKLNLANTAETLVRVGNEVFDLQDLEQKAATTVIGAGSVVIKGTVSIIDIFTGGTTTIDGDNITTGTITADKLNVNELSAITATVGQLIVEEDIGGQGYIRSSGVTDFNDGSGFWLDEQGRLFLGDSTTGTDRVTNGTFSAGSGTDASNWVEGSNWDRVDLGAGDFVMRHLPNSISDRVDQVISSGLTNGVSYIVHFRIRNWVRGAVRPLLGEAVGSNFSRNGTYETTMTAGTANDNLTFQSLRLSATESNPSFDIDDVKLFLASDVKNSLAWDGNSLVIRGNLDVSGTVHADNIVAGNINVDRLPIENLPDPDGQFIASAGNLDEIPEFSTTSLYISNSTASNSVSITIPGTEYHSVIIFVRFAFSKKYPNSSGFIGGFPGSSTRPKGSVRIWNGSTFAWNLYWDIGEVIGTGNNYYPSSTGWYVYTVLISSLITPPDSFDVYVEALSSDGFIVAPGATEQVLNCVTKCKMILRAKTKVTRL